MHRHPGAGGRAGERRFKRLWSRTRCWQVGRSLARISIPIHHNRARAASAIALPRPFGEHPTSRSFQDSSPVYLQPRAYLFFLRSIIFMLTQRLIILVRVNALPTPVSLSGTLTMGALTFIHGELVLLVCGIPWCGHADTRAHHIRPSSGTGWYFLIKPTTWKYCPP